MEITAIIPVREGSRRLKNKNIAPFAGTNLLINKINQLKQVEEISNIVVSSDSDLMLTMAESQGVIIYCGATPNRLNGNAKYAAAEKAVAA